MPAGFPRSTAFRTFSALSKTRASLRAMEPHPFGRIPETMDRATPDWGKQFKKAAVTTSLYVLTSPQYFLVAIY